MSQPIGQSPASGKDTVLRVEIVAEKVDGDHVIWTVDFDDDAVLAFAKIGFIKTLEALATDGKAMEWQEDEPRQEEPTASFKDSPEFFDLQAHFQKEK